MRAIGLRARLVIGVAVVGALQVIAAVVVISIASDQLLDQIDERLDAAAISLVAGGGDRLDGLGDLYVGVVSPDGSIETLNEVADRRGPVPAPEIEPNQMAAASDRPVTVEASRGPVEYRIVAVDGGDDSTVSVTVIGASMQGYEWTMNRLTTLVFSAAAIVLAVLVAVTWWVLRLGIGPIKRMTASAEAIAAGDLSERIETAGDGTEADQLGVALNVMLSRIEASFDERAQAEARLRQFVADASHELRTPVATIRGYSELYDRGGLDDQEALDDAMRRTRHESERMSRLIADMLQLAQLDRGPERAHGPVDVVSMIRDVVADAEARGTGAGVRVTADVVGDLDDVVRGDDDLLRQAIENLIENALVHAGSEQVTVRAAAGDRVIEIAVVDDGRGMAEDVRAAATRRFFRADPSRSRQRGGSGLGLAIVAGIIEVHDGDLRIESSPGRGTTVTITLPTGAESDSQPTPSEL